MSYVFFLSHSMAELRNNEGYANFRTGFSTKVSGFLYFWSSFL